MGGAGPQLGCRGRIGAQKALCETDGADLQAHLEGALGAGDNELGRAAADVDEQRPRWRFAVRGDAPQRERRLLLTRQEPAGEPVARFDLAQERDPVRRVSNGARRDGQHALGPVCARLAPVVAEHFVHTRDRRGEEGATLVHRLAHARDDRSARDLGKRLVLDIGDQ